MRGWLLHKIHPSWLIGWACLGLIVGVGMAAKVNPYLFNDCFWFFLAACLLLISFVGRLKWMIVFVCVGGSLIGIYKASLLRIDLRQYEPYYGQNITLSGTVAQDVSLGDKGDQRFNLTNVYAAGKHLPGQVWVSIAKEDIKRGDTVSLKGNLSPGFGNLSATLYRAQIIEINRPYPGDIARRARDWFANGVRAAIPEPQVSLGLGYLLGQKTALPKDLEEDIKATGLTHAVVASGYNLTILVVFCRKLFIKISKYIATISSVSLVVCFMLITGLSPSMTRAGFVACLGLLVWYYGRQMHPFVLLTFAAAVTVLINPTYVWGDLGWYLSFGSFIGVIVLSPLLQAYFWGMQGKVPMLRQLVVDTLSAMILTTPLILQVFGKFSIYALPVNIMVLPFVPLAMLFTFIAGMFGLILPRLAHYAGLPAALILKYSTEVITRFADLPGAQKDISFNPELMIGSYIGLAAIIFYLARKTKHNFRGGGNNEVY